MQEYVRLVQAAVVAIFTSPRYIHDIVEQFDAIGVGSLTVVLARADGEITVDVVDDGVGLPPGFSIERSGGLGLTIVQTLVTSELGGSMELSSDHGTRVHLTIPLRKTGTASL